VEQVKPIGEPWAKLNVTLGKADFIRFGRACALRRAWVPVLIILIVIPGASCLTAVLDGNLRRIGPLVIGTVLDRGLWIYVAVVLVVLMAYLALIVPWMSWRRARKDRTLGGPIEIALYDNGVSTLSRIGSAFYPWAVFSDVRRSGPLVHLWLSGAKAVLVPFTGPDAPRQADQLFARCRAAFAAARGAEVRKV
jgi:hypothetical protein